MQTEKKVSSSLQAAIENTQMVRMIRMAQENDCAHATLRILRILGLPVGDLKIHDLWKLAQEAGYAIWYNGRFILTEKGKSV